MDINLVLGIIGLVVGLLGLIVGIIGVVLTFRIYKITSVPLLDLIKASDDTLVIQNKSQQSVKVSKIYLRRYDNDYNVQLKDWYSEDAFHIEINRSVLSVLCELNFKDCYTRLKELSNYYLDIEYADNLIKGWQRNYTISLANNYKIIEDALLRFGKSKN